MHSGDVKAVPHSIQCHRPFKLRHGKSVPVMTEVEGNFCNKNEDKNRLCEFTLNTSHSLLCKVTHLEPRLGSTFKRHVAQKPNLMISRITARENQGNYLDFLLIISIGGKLHR